MTIFNSRDLTWSEPMRVWARHSIVAPLEEYLKKTRYELSIHWDLARGLGLDGRPRYELWAVLQTYDANGNQIVRCRGNDFVSLAENVSEELLKQLRQRRPRLCGFSSLFSPIFSQA